MPTIINHKFICDICGDSAESMPITHIPHDDLPIPNKPYDWTMIDGILICPKHEIKKILFVDGKEVL